MESNLLDNSVPEHPMMSPEPFLPKQASTSFPQYNQHPTQLQPLSSASSGHVGPFLNKLQISNKYLLFDCEEGTQQLLWCTPQLPANEAFHYLQGGFHMDPIKQAKAICNYGMNATVLQQQLAEMKSRASGAESVIYNMQGGPSISCLETEPAKHHTACGIIVNAKQFATDATLSVKDCIGKMSATCQYIASCPLCNRCPSCVP